MKSRYIDAMKATIWHVVVAMVAGWLNREQEKVVDYLKEENRESVSKQVVGALRRPPHLLLLGFPAS